VIPDVILPNDIKAVNEFIVEKDNQWKSNMENKDEYAPYKEVYVRVLKTSRTKFKAYVRFQRHNKASMAIITFSSIILLTVPLAQAFNIPLKYNQNVIN